MASGTEEHQVLGSEFAFAVGTANTHQMSQHPLTISGSDTLLLLLPHGENGVTPPPVASFKAPQRITFVRRDGAAICVGCERGAVCVLRAPFLTV